MSTQTASNPGRLAGDRAGAAATGDLLPDGRRERQARRALGQCGDLECSDHAERQ